MKKILSVMIALMLVAGVFSGCSSAKDAAQSAEEVVSQTAEDIAEEATEAAESVADAVSDSDTAAAFYSAYLDAKSELLSRVMDALGSNADTMMAALSFLGATLSDLYMLPATYFGLDESSVTSALAILGAQDVVYESNGNTYTVTYTDSDGQQSVLTGTYDDNKSLVCVGSTNGVENVFSEVYRTSFGYVGQFYSISDDGTTTLYQYSISGENGVVGLSSSSDKPAALTGSESIDFPKSAAEWYAIDGNSVTGVNSDGEAVSFEYVPSDTDD